MKRTLSVLEFKRYIEKQSYSKIIFDTDNQKWLHSALKFHLTFTKLSIHLLPDIICLSGEFGEICLLCAEKVRVDDTNSCLVVIITCGTLDNDIKNTFKLLFIH